MNAVHYDADHDCIWGRPPSTSREEGIWILHKSFTVQDIIRTAADVNVPPELIRVWCDTGEHNTEKGYINLMNLPPQTPQSTAPRTSTPALSQTAVNDSNTNNSAIVSLYHKPLLALMVIIVRGIS
jgi:hypothetical protein